MMIVSKEKVRKEMFYFVGYEKADQRYVLAVVITFISWYNRYDLITKEEYDWFDSDIAKLDLLAEECFQMVVCGRCFFAQIE